MNKPLRRTPMRRVSKKSAARRASPEGQEDAAYLGRVRSLPCCICEAFGEEQLSPTTAHHVFHGRFSRLKTPDNMAIPLCDGHHQGDRDTSKLAIHRAKATWAERYGEDHEYSAATRDRVERMIQ